MLALCQFLVVLVKVVNAHQNAQVRVLAHRLGDGVAHSIQAVYHRGGALRVHHNYVACLGCLRQYAVHQLVVGATAHILAVHKQVAKLKLHLLRQRLQKSVLGLGRKFRKHQVALRLPLSPYLLKSSWVKHRERHEVVGLQGLLAVIEVALGIALLRVFLALLQHLARL